MGGYLQGKEGRRRSGKEVGFLDPGKRCSKGRMY